MTTTDQVVRLIDSNITDAVAAVTKHTTSPYFGHALLTREISCLLHRVGAFTVERPTLAADVAAHYGATVDTLADAVARIARERLDTHF